MKRSDFEIMAPVGSFESLHAAIAAGADAVYFGVGQLNMRSRSSLNFTLDDLRHIVGVCRENGVRTYLTLNIILYDNEMEQAREAVLDRFGRVDILINGAGGNKKEATVSPELDFFHLNVDAFKWVFDLNVTGAVLTTMVFGELLAKQGTGNVINIASMATYHPLTNTVAYCGAKAAVANFTEWMATHFNQNYSKNIRVNAIAPGFLLTTQNRFLMQKEDGTPTDRGQRVLNKTPMGRYGEPEEMAGPVIWLCSEAASFVNGAVIPVDGGFSAFWGI